MKSSVSNKKLKMAIVLSVDYKEWPTGGVLTYILEIIPKLDELFKLSLYGVHGRSDNSKTVSIKGKEYQVTYYATVVKEKHIFPNAFRVFFGMMRSSSSILDNDIIFCHSATELIALKMRYKNRLPFVVYVQHGLNYLNLHNLILKIFISTTGQYAQMHSNMNFIVTDPISFSEYIKRPEKSKASAFYQIGSPINYEALANGKRVENSKKARFIFSGRFDSDKQPAIAIKAFSIYLKKYNSNAELYMLGGGPLLEGCKNITRKLGIENRVIFFGRVIREKVIDKLYESDVCVLPSVGEGMSLSSLEALATGLPVVAFNVMGLRGAVKNGYNGYLVNELNDDNTFADCMNKAYINKNELSINAKKSAKKYDSSVIIDKIYRNIMYEFDKQR
jgi:glycosyltransferase involved in cell wall biosynthesis